MDLTFKVVDTKSNNIAERLGITPERRKVLHEAGKKAFINNSISLADDLAEVSKVCESPVELAYIVFQFGRNVQAAVEKMQFKGW